MPSCKRSLMRPFLGSGSRRRRLGVLVLAAAGTMSLTSSVFGLTRTWEGNTGGHWSNPNDWIPTGVPQPGDIASFGVITPGAGFVIDTDYLGSPLAETTFIDLANANPFWDLEYTTTFKTADDYHLGGTFEQDGDTLMQASGTFTVGASVDGTPGTYQMESTGILSGDTVILYYPTLSAGSMVIGSNGPGQQYGAGQIEVTAGTVSAGSTAIGNGAVGTFTQNGSLTISGLGALQVGVYNGGSFGNGSLILSAGTLSATSTFIGYGGTGTFYQNGSGASSNLGTLTVGAQVSGTSGSGTVLLAGGTLTATATVIGDEGHGTFLQNNDTTVSSLGFLTIGFFGGTGSVSIGDGTMTALSTNIGEDGAGSLTVSGTTTVCNLGTLSVGLGTTGTVSFSNGSLTASGATFGASHIGVYTQTSGSASLGAVVLGAGSHSTGTLNLDGGTLSATQVAVGSGGGTAAFAMGGAGGIANVGTVTIGAQGALTVDAGTLNAQTINSAGTIEVSFAGINITGAGSLGTGSITGIHVGVDGVVDLGTSGLVINYNGGTSPIGELNGGHVPQNYPADSIQRYLQTAIDGGNWDEPGITSSNAKNDVTGVTAVGAIDNGDLLALQGNNYTGKTWMGQSITSDNTVLARFTYNGDTNLDGVVDSIDVDNLIQGFEGFGDGWLYGDFNYDGIVDSLDVTEMIIGYTGQGKPLGDAISPGQAQFLLSMSRGLSAAQIAKFDAVVGVPEPAMLGVAGAAGLGLLARRRGRLIAARQS